jgi:ribonuclease P protein component
MRRANKKRAVLLFPYGKTVASPFFSVRVRVSSEFRGRLVIVVPKKIDKRAVVRNRLKRRIKEFFRQRSRLSLNSYDIVLTAKKEAVSAGAKLFYEELRRISCEIPKEIPR